MTKPDTGPGTAGTQAIVQQLLEWREWMRTTNPVRRHLEPLTAAAAELERLQAENAVLERQLCDLQQAVISFVQEQLQRIAELPTI